MIYITDVFTPCVFGVRNVGNGKVLNFCLLGWFLVSDNIGVALHFEAIVQNMYACLHSYIVCKGTNVSTFEKNCYFKR